MENTYLALLKFFKPIVVGESRQAKYSNGSVLFTEHRSRRRPSANSKHGYPFVQDNSTNGKTDTGQHND
jgi:hypothetical protein